MSAYTQIKPTGTMGGICDAMQGERERERSDNAFCLKCKRRHRKKSIRISEMLNRQFFIPFGYRTQCIFIYTLNNEHQQKATCYGRKKIENGSQWEVNGRRQKLWGAKKKNTICWNRQNQLCSAHKSGSKKCHCFWVLDSIHCIQYIWNPFEYRN